MNNYTKEDYLLIENSKFFDREWYITKYSSLNEKIDNPVEHYLNQGWLEGNNPSESFDGRKYLSHYKTVESSRMNPLLHYERYGKKEGLKTFKVSNVSKLFRLIHRAHLLSDSAYMDRCNVEFDYILLEKSKLFDVKYYSEKYNTSHSPDFDPIEHYLYKGWKEGCNPSSRFDTNFYLSTYKSVKESGENPLVHYEKKGKYQNLRTCCSSVIFPENAKSQKLLKLSDTGKLKRIAVFASFSSNGKIADYVVYYLKQLKDVCDGIIFICDAPLFDGELSKIQDFVIYACAQRHEEYDFGSYKRGYQFLKDLQLLNSLNELVFCNDSCYGPVYDMAGMFHNESCMNSDFWGILPSDEIRFHLQSWFLCFKKNVFTSEVFDSFITSVKREYSVKDVILNYETHYTRVLIDAGFTYGSIIDFKANDKKYPYKFGHNLSLFPIYLLEHGCPFVKVKALTKLGCNYEGVNITLDYIKAKNEYLSTILPSVNKINSIKFSIIMPTFNRVSIIMDAIDSVLAQTYDNFELIIVDDGSSDDTESFIKEHYRDELEKNKIVYVKKRNEGVCKARNYGLRMVRNEWIAYADSDNLMFPHFLESFVTEIEKNSNYKVFYSMFRNRKSHKIIGSSFDYRRLIKENYIDMGTLVHHRSLLHELGGFDENMTRLVDWDLILRYTSKYTPHYIPIPLMLYNDTNGISRISNSVSYENNLNYFRNKHKSLGLKKVTTVITAYNHEIYIEQAIKSAVNQKGWFEHEILISDDFSTDGTPSIVEKYCKKYPMMIKNISSDKNLGISQNLKKCFESASGDYVAILEGDDYWTDDHKLEKQMNFLEKNRDCSMVFSKLRLLNETTQKFSSLSRQNNLRKSKLTGDDVINEPTLNLMGNFSCCMFRTQLMKSLPDELYLTRINEISLSFYLVNHGKIGYISESLSVYRQHTRGIWTGADKAKQLESGLKCRVAALNVCQDKFKKRLQHIIDINYRLPLEKILSESNCESTNSHTKVDLGIRGWLSSSLNKDNELFGYLLNINNKNTRNAVIKIGENIVYECWADRDRTAPKNYLYHRNHGFKVKLDERVNKSISAGEKLKLIDKETGKVVYTTLFKR